MNWTFNDLPIPDGTYTMLLSEGEVVAALAQLPEDMQSNGVSSHWGHYVSVDDVDAMVSKVEAAGGTVIVPPFDVMEEGRMLVLQDPHGVTLSLWQAKNHIGARAVNRAGAMSWNELATRDMDGSKKFYGEVFGWTFDDAGDNYFVIENNGRSNGGMVLLNEQWGEMPPTWSIYFTVADLDATLAAIEPNGGTIVMPKTQIGERGHIAIVSDPTGGGHATLIEMEPEAWSIAE